MTAIVMHQPSIDEVHVARLSGSDSPEPFLMIDGTPVELTRNQLEQLLIVAIERIDLAQRAFQSLAGYAITCQRKNTREWMFGLEHAINRAAELIGDGDRAVCDSTGTILHVRKAVRR